MINGDAIRSFGGLGGANFHTRYQTARGVIPTEPRVGVVIVRGNFFSPGNFIPLLALRVLRYLGFTTILLEHLTILNSQSDMRQSKEPVTCLYGYRVRYSGRNLSVRNSSFTHLRKLPNW